MKRRSILVVDDNAEAAEVLAIGLELLGQEVRTVLDGAAALALLEQWRPDVAILDLSMPGMSGTELARHIRERLGNTLTLVALTGHGAPEDRARTRDAGFDLHWVKPVSLDDVERWLRDEA
jgi:two-component system, OmpR family, response regulator